MFLMKDNHITPAQVKVSASQSYTLAELMELGHEWARSTGGELTDDMAVSWFLLWLGKKEREANESVTS